jgi:glycosyltransferase involved in cell wall biosynthesis
VNDGSSDGTGALLDSLAAANPQRLSVCHPGKNSGKAEAVRTGMLRAAETAPKYDIIGFMDADLSAPLEEIFNIIAAFEDKAVTCAFGSRVKILGSNIERGGLRHYMGRVFATMASLTLDLPVYDTQCGAKFFRNTGDIRKIFAEPFSVSWTFDVELIARVKVSGSFGGSPYPGCIREVPLREWRHKSGSKVLPSDFFLSMLELYKIRSWTKKQLSLKAHD